MHLSPPPDSLAHRKGRSMRDIGPLPAMLLMVVGLAWGTSAATEGPWGKIGESAYSAAFVSQSVPSFIELFTASNVSVTMRNTGTATWVRSEGDVFLATQEPQDNFFWCIQDNPHGSYSGNRVLLPTDVRPG